VLGQNYPNPFNPQTTIDFVIPKSGYTTLKLFDTLGQEVKSLLEANLQTGVVSRTQSMLDRFQAIFIFTLCAAVAW